MDLGLDIIIMWAFAVSLSGIMSFLICGITLKRKGSKAKVLLGYGGAYTIGFVFLFIIYYNDITNDVGGVIVMPALIWGACLLLHSEHWSSKLLVAGMSTLVSNVTTFFICGPAISIIDTAATPYNLSTITIFIALKVILFALLFVYYKYKLRATVCESISIMDGGMGNSLSIAIMAFIGFCLINAITGGIGMIPTSLTIGQYDQEIDLLGHIEIHYNIIAFYGFLSLIFIFEFWQIISAICHTTHIFRTQSGLNVASKIQQDMLPSVFPAYQDRSEFDIYASMQPAKEVGGDFYDFFLIDDNTLAVVIADVSDKGVPAALFMVITKTIIKNSALSGKNPKEVFETANNILCENNESGMFATAFLGYLDISSGRFIYVNAGHNLPLVRFGNGKPSDRRYEWLKADPGFVLAGMGDISFKLHEITLQHGDELFLYTDGVTEAVNEENELYGDLRLLETVNNLRDLPLDELITSMKERIGKFSGRAEQADDITMLALRLY